MAWDNSTRRERLPGDWQTRRIRVLRRDGYRCQARSVSGVPCHAPARDVDHVVPGDDHSLDNLQALCVECHKAKTLAERPKLPPRRRRPEAHPGGY